jgi:hypothetical protein
MIGTRNYQNWLVEWVSQFEGTEVPQAYAIWTGIWCIAAAMKDNVWMQRGHSQLFPHLYIFLVGPSGSGKSYTAEEAVNFLRTIPTVNIHSGEMTKSYMISYLEGIVTAAIAQNPLLVNPHPAMSLFSDELAQTISSGERASEFLRGMTQFYNSTIESGTHAHSMRKIEKPVICWLALATTRWLKLSVPPDMVDSGFVARVITVVEGLSQRIVPELPPVDNAKRRALIQDLAQIATINGEFILSPQAREVHTEWYINARQQRLSLRDEVTISIYGRDDEHVFKVAMILSAAHSNDRIITAPMLRNAASLVQHARSSNLELYRGLATGNSIVAYKHLLLDKLLNSEGAISHTQMRRMVSGIIPTTKLFQEAMGALIDEGFVKSIVIGSSIFYRLTTDSEKKEIP